MQHFYKFLVLKDGEKGRYGEITIRNVNIFLDTSGFAARL